MSENHIIKLHLYPFDVMLSMGQSDDNLKASMEGYGLEFDEKTMCFKRDSNVGYALMLTNGQSIIRLRSRPGTRIEYAQLQHEIFHVVTFIMERIGMPLRVEISDEAYSYMIEYLTKQIYEILWDSPKEERIPLSIEENPYMQPVVDHINNQQA